MPAALVALAVVVTGVVSWQAYRVDVSAYRQQFRADAALWAERVASRAEQGLVFARAAAVLVERTPVDDPDVAGVVVASRLAANGPVDAAGWLPVPPADGEPRGFTVHGLLPGSARPFHEQAAGAWSGPDRDRIRRALEAGRPVLVWLEGGALRTRGLLVAVPVEAGLFDAQPTRPVGFAFGVVPAASLMDALRMGGEECPFELEIVDPAAFTGLSTVHRFTPGDGAARGPLAWLLTVGWRDAGGVRIPRSDLSIDLSPTPAYRASHHSLAPGLILVLGALLVAGLVTDHLRNVRPTRARVRKLLEERSQRQVAEGALRESQAMLRLVLDAIPVRVHWKDTASVYRGCNRRFAEDAEVGSPDAIVGRTDHDLPWARYAELYQSRDRQVLTSGEPLLGYEQPRTTGAGELRWLRQSKLPLRDGAGRIIGVLTAYEDITEAKAAVDALAASERKYRELVEHANTAIVILTREGAVSFVNEFGQRLFGYAAAELVGRPALGTFVPAVEEGGRDLGALLRELCAHPDDHPQSVNENLCRDGRRVWMSWHNRALLDEQGALAGVFCIGSDVTEQRRAEEALHQARQELEARVAARTAELSRANADLEARAAELAAANARLKELDRLKSEFLATMSHELRTPLNSVIGFTGILRQGLAGPVNDEQVKQLGMVLGSATHLLSLINDLLDLSRIEAGKVELDVRPFDFAAVVAEVAALCQPALAQKGLAFHAELPGEPLALVGDRKRCLQVLLNLAGNAVKFTARGEVRIAARVAGDRLRVTVSDTGIGIRPEHQAMLFEAFRQVDGSARRVYEGTGLGLYLSRKLLHLMGGDISVESVHGEGSRFSFTLPIRIEAAAPGEVHA